MTQNDGEIVGELESIKKLLILGLVKYGLTQTEVATALSIDRTTVARMFPTGFLSKLKKGG